MTTYYDLYEDNPWRKVAEMSQEELAIPGMMELQAKLGRYIVPLISFPSLPATPQERL